MKTCEYCGIQFERPYKLAFKQWQNRRFCNMKCRGLGSKPSYSYPAGHKPWNKGVSTATNTGRTHFKKGAVPWNKGIEVERPPWNKGIRYDAIRKEKHWNWQGGKPKKNRFREMTYEENRQYLDWRKAVFERDNYTCQTCDKRGGDLHADHIKPWVAFPDSRFELTNGQTLCAPCHRKTPTYSRQANTYNA